MSLLWGGVGQSASCRVQIRVYNYMTQLESNSFIKVQQEAVHIFYSNIYNIDYTQLSFETKVYGVRMLINPDQVSMLLGIARPSAGVVVFPN